MKEQKIQEILTLVKNNYQEIANDFDLTRKKEIWPEIKEWAAKVKDNDQILDLGCGNGRLLEALKDKQINYLGLDNSSELIEIAKNNYPDREFISGDMLNLESAVKINFDFIFCLAALQHIPSKKLRLEVLKQMAAKLKIGGEIIVSNWNLWSHKKYRWQLIKNYWLKISGQNKLDFNDLIFPWKNPQGKIISLRYYHAFTKKELKKLARLANLKIIALNRDKYNFWLVLKRKEV